jgi:acetoin utilization deacetylase AcuC-like enzyme
LPAPLAPEERMKVVCNPEHHAHQPDFFLFRGRVISSKEQPARLDALLAGVRDARLDVIEPNDYGIAPAAAVHTARYLDFLQHGHALWATLPDASAEIVANVHPLIAGSGYPQSIVGRAGYHMSDTACPIGAGTWRAALRGSHAACHAAELVMHGEDAAYVLTRPPGHHAGRERAGGFCYINNAAVAAERLRSRASRVAIIDVDVHHGNGTQEIFYERRDVLHVSLHADPSLFYPFFTGYREETGAGEGRDCNVNLPLPIGTGDADYLRVLADACDTVSAYRPDALVIALGLDIYRGDPLSAFAISKEGFHAIGRRLGAMAMPTVIVQEGGYLSPALGTNLGAFLDGYVTVRSR